MSRYIERSRIRSGATDVVSQTATDIPTSEKYIVKESHLLPSHYFNTVKRYVSNHRPHSKKGRTNLIKNTSAVEQIMPCEELKKDCTDASDATPCSQQNGLSPIGLALLVDVRKRGLNVNLKPKKSNSSNNSIDISLSDLESSTDTYLSSTPTYTPITLHTNDRLSPTERVNSTELIEEDEEEDDNEISHPQPQSEDHASPHVWLSSLPFARRNRLKDLRYRSMSLARTTSGLCHRSNELDPTTSSNALVRSYSNTSDRYSNTNGETKTFLRKIATTRISGCPIHNDRGEEVKLSDILRNTSLSSRQDGNTEPNTFFQFH